MRLFFEIRSCFFFGKNNENKQNKDQNLTISTTIIAVISGISTYQNVYIY